MIKRYKNQLLKSVESCGNPKSSGAGKFFAQGAENIKYKFRFA